MSSPSRVAIATTPLYGVLVSRKSYLIGLRCLVKTYHARMLAHKVVADRLPQELVDLIVEQLAKLEHGAVARAWKGTWEEKERRFRYWRGDRFDWTTAQRMAFEEVAKLNTDAVLVDVAKVYSGQQAHYMHLSAHHPRPALGIDLPSDDLQANAQAAGSRETLVYRGLPSRNVRMAVHCRPDRPEQSDGFSLAVDDLSQERVVYMTKSKEIVLAERCAISRVLELSGVEAAIAAWDQAEIERCVELLQLKSVESDRGLKPALRLLQVIEEE